MDQDINNIANNLWEYLRSRNSLALKIGREEFRKSIIMNFQRQGSTIPWAKKKRPDGRAILTGKSGRLQRELNVFIENDETITASSSLPYSKIQNEGGTINMPARKLRFRKLKKNEVTGKRRTVFASSKHKRISKEKVSKPYTITIPARPYLVIAEQDYPRILNSIANQFK